MSNIEERRRYARQRRFEYPDERVQESEYHAQRFASNGMSTDENYGENDDIYAKMARNAINRGELDEAFELFMKSIGDGHNLESISELADLISLMFINQYGDTGYSGNDMRTNNLVEFAMGLYITYCMFSNDTERIRQVVNTIGALFHNKMQFMQMIQRVQKKCEGMTPEQFIEFSKSFRR